MIAKVILFKAVESIIKTREAKETFVVEKLSDGNFLAPGPFYGGRMHQ